MLITTVEVDLPALASSVVSHLGWPVRDSPVLKVVSSVAIAASEFEVGILCTKTCDTGVSRSMVIVPDIRCTNVPTLLLSKVALINSMVVRVTILPRRETVCPYVAARPRLMSSLRSRVVVGSGSPSHLRTRRCSLAVRPFYSRGLLLVLGFAGACIALVARVSFSLLPFLATVAHNLGCAAVGRGIAQTSDVAFLKGAPTGSVKGNGVGVSGPGVVFLRVLTSSVSASI